MPVKKVRLMITNEDGTEEQVYPLTDVNAVHGLKEFLNNGQLKIGVMSVNGQSGDITIPVLDEEDFVELTEMLDAYEKGEIGGQKGEKGDKGDTGEKGKDGAGVENIKLHRAWAWNSEGTDRFTTVYPNENLLLNTSDEWQDYDFVGWNFDVQKIYISEIGVSPGDTVCLSGDYNNNGESSVRLQIPMYDSDDKYIKQAESNVLKAGERGHITSIGVIDVRTNYILIPKVVGTSGTETKKGQFRKIKLERGSTATPYTPSPLDDFANAYPTHEGLYFGFDDPSDDPSNYKPFVRILGQQGEQGIQGVQGERGLQGEQGIQGEKGEPGTNSVDVVATDTTNGLMSAEDKAKLDSFSFVDYVANDENEEGNEEESEENN